jgi:transposase
MKTSHLSCTANFLRGRKCLFCGSFKTNKTARGYVKCRRCYKQKSLSQLRREIEILKGFYHQIPAYRLASDLGLDVKTVTRVYQQLRQTLYHQAERDGGRLRGQIELDESYFGDHRKGSVYFTDRVRGYQSLKRFGKHHVVNHSKTFVERKTKNHINGIEGFWSYAKHILYNYRGVSKYHFPMYLKEIEYRFNHRNENVFKCFLKLYFGYDSP